MKKVISFLLSMVCCLTIGCANIAAEEYRVNPEHIGTYNMLGMLDSWIIIRSTNCSVHVVYSQNANQFISSTCSDGYMNNNHFLMNFDSYAIVNQSGNIISSVHESTFIQGTVTVTSKYTDININGMTYEKTN